MCTVTCKLAQYHASLWPAVLWSGWLSQSSILRWQVAKIQIKKEENGRTNVDPGGPVVIILDTGSEVREVRPWNPCRRFMARKRTSSRN